MEPRTGELDQDVQKPFPVLKTSTLNFPHEDKQSLYPYVAILSAWHQYGQRSKQISEFSFCYTKS